MICKCELPTTNDYSITLVQGDYGSYLFNITNSDGTALDNVNSVIFTCSRLKVQESLSQFADNVFSLILNSELTKTFTPCTCSYDITIKFNDDATPYTVIRSASLTILKKENPLSG